MRCTTRIILPLALFFITKLQAQQPDEKNFAHYTIKEGLTNNQVTSVTQDKYGYTWIATTKGLNRFDGNSFVQFYADSSRNSLPQDNITQLEWLDNENLGAETATGLHILNTRTLQSRNIIIPAGELTYRFRVNRVMGTALDKSGNLFILTGSGFYQYNKKDEPVFRYDHFNKKNADIVSYQFGRNMIQLHGELYLLSTIGGLYIYDAAKKDLHPAGKKDDPFYTTISPPGQGFFFMHRDEGSFSVQKEPGDEIAFFNTRHNSRQVLAFPLPIAGKFNWKSKVFRLSDSLYAINAKEKGFYLVKYNRQTNYYTVDPTLYFENYFCSSICLDKDGRLWIGTSQGLFREKRQSGKIERVTVPLFMNPFGTDLQIRMVAAANDKLFAATAKQGIVVFDRASMTAVKQIDLSTDWHLANNAFSAIMAGKDTLVSGTSGVMIWVDTRNYTHGIVPLPQWIPERYWLPVVFKDSRNNIYACRATSDVFYYRGYGHKNFSLEDHSGNKFFRIARPQCMAEDPEGNIWFAAEGISRYNTQLKQFDRLLDSFPFMKDVQKRVNCLAIDKKGDMYFGLRENGLIIYKPDQEKFLQLTRGNGLPDNNINAIYIHKDKVWMGTESGLASYDIVTKKISSFGIADNMPAEPFTASTFYFDSAHHHLYGAFANTLVRFNPDSLSKNTAPPLFFIESIIAEGSKTFFHPADAIKLSYKHNNLVISMAAINFEDAYQQRFAYRFVKNGNDAEAGDEWQQAGPERSIIISNLSPGKHRLQVKVFIKNNSWEEQVREITIIIRPPFWQLWWFIVLMGVAALALITAFVKWRVGTLKKTAQERLHSQQLKTEQLQLQLEMEQVTNYFTSSVAGKKTTEEVLWDVARNLIGRLGFVDCMIYLWNDDKTKMIQKAGYGLKGSIEEIQNRPFDVVTGQGVVGYVIKNREPVLIGDTSQDGRYRPDEAERLSEICVPIIYDGELIGIIDSEHAQKSFYTKRHLQMMTTVAALVANKIKSIESDNLYQQKQTEIANLNHQLAKVEMKALHAQMNPHFIFNS
ncbi:MAG TPA: two-component regulator propeller domain-containing protein, partial [Chitinophagaceae bacterium]|nr:two-component regulator propeller domain-containing protein [Chitinophagaceae bacterium]